MADLDQAAGSAEEGKSLAETCNSQNSSLAGFLDTALTAVGDAPKNIGSVLNSIQHTLIARQKQIGEIAENAQDHVRAADETGRYDATEDASTRLEAVKQAVVTGALVLEDARGYAYIAQDNLRELVGALTVVRQQCDGVSVELLAGISDIEELIRRLS